ncbi:PepSY domain-containing protein [Lysobacter sp. A3-1-A15]|uniref:PepSY domain-containing protein n=1 Tax=Novilysobacter viscosus TaxID=3098602 RepID=UPI002ED925A3
MIRLLTATVLLVLLAMIGPLGEARAQSAPQRESPARHDRGERGEDRRALSDAVRRVERRTGGQVLSAERVPFDGRNVNRVKVLDASGRIRVYMDDPRAPRAADQVQRRTRGDDD